MLSFRKITAILPTLDEDIGDKDQVVTESVRTKVINVIPHNSNKIITEVDNSNNTEHSKVQNLFERNLITDEKSGHLKCENEEKRSTRSKTVDTNTEESKSGLLKRRRHSEVMLRPKEFKDKCGFIDTSTDAIQNLVTRRLSAATVAKLGASEYGRAALRASATADNKFKVLGKRIWNMIKVKNMFLKQEDEEASLLDYKKNGNRTKPRFSSTLSPEAQLAIMKGYEDKTYEQISKVYPASKIFLKRNRTPVLNSNDGKQSAENKPTKGWDIARETKTKLEVINAFSIHDENNTESPLARRRASALTFPNFAVLYRQDNQVAPQKRERSNSLPVLVPDDKQRVLAFRMENAMDILDAMKSSQGQQVVSPRLKSYPNPIRPVKAYNKWAELWKQDFRSVKS